VKWTVVATVGVPNLVPGEGAVEDNVLGMAAVLESNRGAVQRQVPLTVEAEAARVAVDQVRVARDLCRLGEPIHAAPRRGATHAASGD